MKLITITLLSLLSFSLFGQECNFLPADTVVCGFKHNFQITEEEGSFVYSCEQEKFISITHSDNGSAMFSFSQCGEYEIIFESATENCQDTFRVEINDPSSSVTTLQTLIDLGYGDIDCPEDVMADCDAESVSIPIPTGTPTPIWDFCTTASCQTTIYITDTGDLIEGCIVDTIICDTTFVVDASDECVDTFQNAFIVLNSEGDMVDNNTFLEYLAQLQASLDLECSPVIDGCYDPNEESCYDTTEMDTTYLHIPVRIGGKWTLANIDSVELFDTTYFEYMGNSYELILDPGVEFYGPGNLNVYLYEIMISGSDTTKNFPYGIDLVLQWEEDWIIDTLQLIKEIPIDTTGDCLACGGNFFNSFFDIPGIPEFPCGPVSISYPEECECEYEYPDYSIQLLQCEPKEWWVDVLGGEYEFIDALGAEHSGGFNATTLFNASSENVTMLLQDDNGCIYDININLESIIEEIVINPSGEPNLACDVSAVQLVASVQAFNGEPLAFMGDPIWRLPDGNEEVGISISASEPGEYQVSYVDVIGCTHESIFSVEYSNEIYIIEDHLDICGNDGVEYQGTFIDGPGLYEIEIDCNEFINLTVNQYDYTVSAETYQVCEGESIQFDGQYFLPGIYEIEVSNGTPCPDIVNLYVEETSMNLNWNLEQNCEGNATLHITHDASAANYTISNNGSAIGNYTSTGNSFDLIVESSGDYQIDVEHNGCISSFEIIAELQEYQIMPIQNGMLTCTENCRTISPEIVNLRGNVYAGDYTVLWTGPNNFISTEENIQVCEGGNYTIELIYGDNCIVAQNVEITEDFEPQIQFIDVDLCYGECYDDGTYVFCQTTQTIIDVDECTRIEVDVIIGEEMSEQAMYSICEGERIIINDVEFEEEGDYSEVFITDSGCDSTLYFTIDVLERGEILSEHMIDCQNDNALLQYASLNSNETYVWRDENGNELSYEAFYEASEAGIYYVDVFVEGDNGTCSFTEEYELLDQKVFPEIGLEEIYTLNCENEVTIDVEVLEGSTWVWESMETGQVVENSDLNTGVAGIYNLTVTNVEGCQATSSIELIQIVPVSIEYTSKPTCEGEEEGAFLLTKIEGGIPPFKLLLDDVEIEEETISGLGSGVYELSILQGDGCVFEEAIEVEEIPGLDEMPVQTIEYCNNNGVTVSLDLQDGISYRWLDGYDSPERTIREEGIYEVEFSNGCNTVVGTYHVDDTRVDENYVVSNIFSPRGSSENTKMKVVPQVEYQDFKLYIFSRDGSLVYETTDPSQGWDGKIGGSKVVIGSYVWMIESTIYDCGGGIEKAQDVGTVMVIY